MPSTASTCASSPANSSASSAPTAPASPPPSRCSPAAGAHSGRIEILGDDLDAHPVEVKRHIGVVPGRHGAVRPPDRRRVPDFCRPHVRPRPRPPPQARRKSCSSSWNSPMSPRKLITDYSHGMKKKLALAAAVIHRPETSVPRRAVRGRGRDRRRHAEGHAARHDRARGHDLPHVARARNRRASLHPRRHHSSWRFVAQGSLEELRAGVEAQTHADPARTPASPTRS